MSIAGAMSAYEKMLENPANRRNTSGELKQPTPNAQGEVAESATIEDADDRWIKGLDVAMAARKNKAASAYEKMNENTENTENQVLNELKEVKEMLKMVLDANLKLLKKL